MCFILKVKKKHHIISGLGGPKEVPVKSIVDNVDTLPMDVAEIPTPQSEVARQRPPSFQDADARRKNYQNATTLNKGEKQTSPPSASTRTPDDSKASSSPSYEPPPRRVRQKTAPAVEIKPPSVLDAPAESQVLGMELDGFLVL